jgi:rod shape-determining protein MreD
VVVMVWVAVATTPMPAQLAGMVTGLARDVFTGRPFGLGGFAGTLIGYAVARFAQHLLVRQPRTLALVFALAAAAEQAIVAVLESVLMGDPVVPSIDQVAIRVAATTALGVVWYNSEHALLRSIARWRRERGGRLRLG